MVIAKKRLLWYGASPVLVIGLAATALAFTGTKLGFHGGDGRLTTSTGDWAPGDNKGECGGSAPFMVGVSKPTNNSQYTDAILCYNSLGSGWNYNAVGGVTLSNLRNADSRRDTSTGDWAPGFHKAECATNEVMTGLAQTTTPNAAFDKARCSAFVMPPTAHVQYCYTRSFGSGDDLPGQPGYGDWEPGYYKGTCNTGDAIKGAAAQTSTGGNSVQKILCCHYAQ